MTFGMATVILCYALGEAIPPSQPAWVNVVSDSFFLMEHVFFQMIKCSEIINIHTHSCLFKFWIMQTRTLSEESEGELFLENYYSLLDEITIKWFVTKSIKKNSDSSACVQLTSIFSSSSTTFVIIHFSSQLSAIS